MLYYELKMKCTMKVDKKVSKMTRKNKQKALLANQLICKLNEALENKKSEFGLEHFGARDCEILGVNEEREMEYIFSVIAAKSSSVTFEDEENQALANMLGGIFPVYQVGFLVEEITPEQLLKNKDKYNTKSGMAFFKSLPIPDRTYGEFQYAENCIDTNTMTLAEALKTADELMVDEAFKEELQRIYSEDNCKEFVTHPVHYYMTAPDKQAYHAMLQLLLKSLMANKRLPSERMDLFYDVDNHIDNVGTMGKFFKMAEGASVILETTINTSIMDCGESNIVEILSKKIASMATNTLFVVQENKENDCFGKQLVDSLSGKVRFVKLGTAEKLSEPLDAVLERMAFKCGLEQLYKANPPQFEDQPEGYTSEQVTGIFNSWAENTVSQKVYKAYADTLPVKQEKTQAVDSMVELDKLIGLKVAKDTAKQLISAAKVKKARMKKGLAVENNALHMLFTGNPGSAKTTFARLIAKILAENGITKSSRFVECGRVDLVGKYVGWTANCVKDKFKEASGGVLFIDEAYSLCGEGNDFGAEAISTIVQEMENHRDDVIVIFAGYPDKMEEFLKQNEGLRSRIPYHMDFPDYSEDELMAILKKFAEDREYELSPGFEKKCRIKIQEALQTKNFGNGRFVRNMLELAIAKQAVRINRDCNLDEIEAKALMYIKAEDFPNILVKPVVKAHSMGIAL